VRVEKRIKEYWEMGDGEEFIRRVGGGEEE
jgi:hypothetical protein